MPTIFKNRKRFVFFETLCVYIYMYVCVCLLVFVLCVHKDSGIKATIFGRCAFGSPTQSVKLSLVKSRSNTNIVSNSDIMNNWHDVRTSYRVTVVFLEWIVSIAWPQSAMEGAVVNLQNRERLWLYMCVLYCIAPCFHYGFKKWNQWQIFFFFFYLGCLNEEQHCYVKPNVWLAECKRIHVWILCL